MQLAARQRKGDHHHSTTTTTTIIIIISCTHMGHRGDIQEMMKMPRT